MSDPSWRFARRVSRGRSQKRTALATQGIGNAAAGASTSPSPPRTSTRGRQVQAVDPDSPPGGVFRVKALSPHLRTTHLTHTHTHPSPYQTTIYDTSVYVYMCKLPQSVAAQTTINDCDGRQRSETISYVLHTVVHSLTRRGSCDLRSMLTSSLSARMPTHTPATNSPAPTASLFPRRFRGGFGVGVGHGD